MADPLDPTALVSLAKSLVSPSAALTSPTQALALLIHSVHSALAFRLIDPTPGRAAEHPNALPEHWPVPGAELKFKYRHHQSSLDFVVSVIDLGGRALIAGAAVENPRSTSFDLLLTDYFSPSALSPSSPLPVSTLSPSNPFSSPTRLKDLVVLYRLNVLQKLIPGLSKEGYSELSERAAGAPAPSSSSREGGGARTLPPVAGTGPYLPDAGGPMGVYPPAGAGAPSGSTPRTPYAPRPLGGGDDDEDPLRVPNSGGRGRPLADIGRRDLEPLGGMGGTFGAIGAGGGGLDGFGGVGGLGGGMGGNGGGMFMGPDHPLFRERFGPGSDGVGRLGPGRRWGGDGYLPPMGAPPGARFDPVVPGNGPPGTGPLGGQGPQPGGGTGGGNGARRVHPDMEQPGPGSSRSDYDAMFG
ncbi:hypothetical protein JCM1841_001727 [Sporobolomyces salmonicolor]